MHGCGLGAWPGRVVERTSVKRGAALAEPSLRHWTALYLGLPGYATDMVAVRGRKLPGRAVSGGSLGVASTVFSDSSLRTLACVRETRVSLWAVLRRAHRKKNNAEKGKKERVVSKIGPKRGSKVSAKGDRSRSARAVHSISAPRSWADGLSFGEQFVATLFATPTATLSRATCTSLTSSLTCYLY